MRVIGIIQARMSSTRLPGKVLLPLSGDMTALKMVVLRTAAAINVDEVIVATTTNPADRAIVDYCERHGWEYFRGSEENVLSRVLKAAKKFKADIIVDITADCPFIDPRHIETLIRWVQGPNDYASNIVNRTLPDGFDVQVYTREALERVSKMKHNPEHSGWNILEQYNSRPGSGFSVAALKDFPKKYQRPELALTLDTPRDYQVMQHLLSKLYGGALNKLPSLIDFTPMERFLDAFLADKKLRAINKSIKRKVPKI